MPNYWERLMGKYSIFKFNTWQGLCQGCFYVSKVVIIDSILVLEKQSSMKFIIFTCLKFSAMFLYLILVMTVWHIPSKAPGQ